MKNICYLCGSPISCQQSGDHVIPRQLIERKQPRVRGFDYGGKLPSHAKCNNQFGPEIHCKKAMSLIRLLHDPSCFFKCQHQDSPNIKVLAIDSSHLPDLSPQDLRFFKFIDVRNSKPSEWSKPSFFTDKTKTNPLEQALFVSLSVLAKSGAALLVSRELKDIPARWRIIAIPYHGKDNAIDFDDLVANTKPFDIGVKVWLKPVNNGNWWVIYKAFDTVVFMFYWLSCISSDIVEISPFKSEAQCFEFQSRHLVDLVDYQWRQI